MRLKVALTLAIMLAVVILTWLVMATLRR